MKIVNVSKLENCIDGDFVCKYNLDSAWTKDSIHALKELGRLTYYANFPKPMFQISCNDGAYIKGVQGMSECRVVYDRSKTDEAKARFEKLFEAVLSLF